MLEKRNCNKCEYSYDNALDSCPKCHEKNETQPKSFKNMTMVVFWKQIAVFLVGWLCLHLFGLVIQLIMAKANGINSNEAWNQYFGKPNVGMLINSLCYLLTLATLLLILFKDIKKLITSFKNWKALIAGIVCLLFIFAFNYVYTSILNIAGVKISNNNNESSLVVLSDNYKLVSILIFGIVGPICEEITYRVGLFSFGKRINKWVAYIITIIVFTLIHFDFEAKDIVNELINLPLYAFPALAFCYTYDKYGFAASLTAHLLNNVISLSLISVIGLGVII